MAFQLHPFSGGSLPLLWNKARTYDIDQKYWPRMASALALSAAGLPERAIAQQRFKAQIKSYSFRADPVFILGHWRSGTTYLHHLMSQDKRFSYVSSYQAFVPETFLADPLIARTLIEKSLPQKRPMDNIKLSLQKPEEEELAMGNVCSLSYIDSFAFPRHAREIFDRSILFEGITPELHRRWGEEYVRLLKIACIGMGRNVEGDLHYRPLLKSPGNTARIPTLLKLFPNAKFVHIYRNPYTIFASKLLTCLKLIEVWQLQEVDPATVEENVFYIYEQTLERYFRDRALIPPENLIEIRYERFEQDQLNTLEKIYRQFEISDFERWKPEFETYITARSGYQKNEHTMAQNTIDKISDRWQFAIEKWGYQPPGKQPHPSH